MDFRAKKSGKVLVVGSLMFLALFLLSNCMLEPFDQQKVPNTTDSIFFTGGVPTPDSLVTIEAYDPNGDTWETIVSTLSTDFTVDAKGTELFTWEEWVTIPGKYWTKDCASIGYVARVRSTYPIGYETPGYQISVEQDAASCFDQSADFQEFIGNCHSSQSPTARVYTEDFRDFGQECVDRINKLRALEGLGPLQRYKEKECAADQDAKATFETGDHSTGVSGASAQNLCPDYPSVDSVLNNCIEQQMYYDEKSCYQQYGSNCYESESPPCKCGHYNNMTDLEYNYTKVACGLYKTSSGGYYSVQDFFR